MESVDVKRLVIRAVVSVVGFVICALGMALSAKIALGISPFSSFPYVLSLLGDRTLGFYCSALYILYIGIQLAILRREFKPQSVLQIGSSVLLGYFVDVWGLVLTNLPMPNYPVRLVYLVLSIVIMAIGVTIYMEPDFMPVPVDGLVQVIATKRRAPFGKIKRIHDVTVASCSIVLSLAMLGRVEGVREGTIITALTLGRVITQVKKYISVPLHELCFGKEK